jgi:hypothetical protein
MRRCALSSCTGVYVGLDPEVSKGYARGANVLVVSKLVRGPAAGLVAPGTPSPPVGHNQPNESFLVVHTKEQLLPFAVLHFA